MEGVGARFGRSSNRYTTTAVFTGPVRRWKKKWVHLTPSASAHHHHSSSNGTVDGANGSSHLLMYKWTPVAPSRNKDANSNGDNAESEVPNKDDVVSADEPPRRKFKFIPVAVLEAENNDFLEQNEDEAKPIEIDADAAAETDSKVDEKPDINDVPMDEIQASEDEPPQRQDLNKSSLDLSLGLKSDERENESEDKAADLVGNANDQRA